MFKITNFVDNKYGLESTEIIRMELSKYSSYPTMCIYRQFGIKQFIASSRELRKIGLDKSNYFNLYFFALLLFGEKFCNNIVRLIKRIIGRRLQL